jgi:hypothetical protein
LVVLAARAWLRLTDTLTDVVKLPRLRSPVAAAFTLTYDPAGIETLAAVGPLLESPSATCVPAQDPPSPSSVLQSAPTQAVNTIFGPPEIVVV